MTETPEETPALDDVENADEFVGEAVEPEHDVDVDALPKED